MWEVAEALLIDKHGLTNDPKIDELYWEACRNDNIDVDKPVLKCAVVEVIDTHARSGEFGEMAISGIKKFKKKVGDKPIFLIDDEEWMSFVVISGNRDEIIAELTKLNNPSEATLAARKKSEEDAMEVYKREQEEKDKKNWATQAYIEGLFPELKFYKKRKDGYPQYDCGGTLQIDDDVHVIELSQNSDETGKIFYVSQCFFSEGWARSSKYLPLEKEIARKQLASFLEERMPKANEELERKRAELAKLEKSIESVEKLIKQLGSTYKE